MSTVLSQDTFECYQYYKQPSSLIKSALKWLLIHIALLIFYLPLSIILFVSLLFSICCFKEASIHSIPINNNNKKQQLLNVNAIEQEETAKCGGCERIKLLYHPTVIYLFITSLFLLLYIIDVIYDVINHLHIEEFFTLTPYVLFILFKDAIAYSLNMRKALLTARFIFADVKCCKIYTSLFTWILKNYWIWGVKINPRKPQKPNYNSNKHNENNNINIHSIISNYIPLDFKQVPLCYNIGRLHTIYSKDEYALFILSVCAGFGFIFLSFAYYIYKYHATSGGDAILLWMIFSIGIMYKIFTVLCVARFIELIFQGFQIYYDHMNQLSKEIEFDQRYNDKQVNNHYIQLKNRLKQYDAIKRKANCNYDRDQEIDSISQRTSFYIGSVHEKDTIDDEHEHEQKHEQKHNDVDDNEQILAVDLSLEDEWVIWFENWCRIEKLSSLYFHNRQNIIFGIIMSTLIAITITFYQIFIWDTLIDELNLSCFCGLIYVIIVVLRFILWSFKFSILETKQIQLIRKQKMYINHKKILFYKRDDSGNMTLSMNLEQQQSIYDEYTQHKIGEYDAICKYLQDVICHIQERSLCPKIAGLTLNKAFVKLTITSILTYTFAWVLYRLRQDYIDEK